MSFQVAIDTTVNRLVRVVVEPVTSLIPVLVRTGLLFAGFAIGWAAIAGALVLRPELLSEASAAVAGWPLPVQGLAWLLFLPLMAGLWVAAADWPFVLRLALMAALAAWNLLVLRPAGPTDRTPATTMA